MLAKFHRFQLSVHTAKLANKPIMAHMHDVSVILAPWPSTMGSHKQDCLIVNYSAYFIV